MPDTTLSTKQRAELLKTAFAQALPALELSVALFNYLVSRDTLEMAGFAVTESMTEFDTFTTFVRESWYSGKCWLPASVVLVGHQGAGKTTLATRLLTGKFDNSVVSTRGVEMCTCVAAVVPSLYRVQSLRSGRLCVAMCACVWLWYVAQRRGCSKQKPSSNSRPQPEVRQAGELAMAVTTDCHR